jgi:2-keto-3-deoxy-L-rhamnonate aldolase RhmA
MGFDWMVYDTEHSPYDIETAQKLMQAASFNSDCTPLIRVAWNDMVMIKKALDTGAYGVIVPWVNTREEAEYAVRACMYPPEGNRGCGPRRAALYDSNYIKTANNEVLIGLQIETQTALDNLDDIISVKGVDVCFIGPNDLSLSLGIHQQYDHPKFQEALDTVLTVCKRHNVAPGIYCSTETINTYLELGFRFCSLASDMLLFIKGMRDALSNIKGWTATPYKP